MSSMARKLAALAGVALVLAIATWFDATLMREARVQAAATFDSRGLAAMFAAGSLLVAGSVLLVGVLAWRVPSIVVGLAYAILGGLFTTLPWLVWSLAAGINDRPPVLPAPLAAAVSAIYTGTQGPLNAVGTIGAAMMIAGVVALLRSQRGRIVRKAAVEARSPVTDPTPS